MNIYFWIALVVQAIVCGCLSQFLADTKGHSPGGWFACGFFFGIFGLIAAAGLPMGEFAGDVRTDKTSPKASKKCPDCAEMVRQDARVCRYCGHRFTAKEDETAQARMTEALRDSDAGVRLAAIRSLQRIGDKNAAHHIMDALEFAEMDQSLSVQQCLALEDAASDALKTLGTETVVSRLVALARGEGSNNVVTRAIETLGAIGGPEAMRALVELLLYSDRTSKPAAACIEGLGEAAIAYLEQATKHGTESTQREATRLLKSIKGRLPA